MLQRQHIRGCVQKATGGRKSSGGLCGGFNASIARLAREEIARLTAQGKTVKILAVGRKGRDALRRMHGEKIVKTFEFSGVRSIGFVNAEEIAATVLDMFEAGEFDVCTLFYSRFQSVVSQIFCNLCIDTDQKCM